MNGKNRLPGVARRMNDIAPFHVMELLTRARQLEAEGRSIVHMEVGEPDFPTPPQVIEAASAFIRGGKVFYTPALGIPALREAIARFYAERYGVKIAPERIAVTAGSSGALLLALAALLDPGDEVLLPDPGYPCNRHFVRTLEGVPRALPVGAETDYQPTADQVARHWTGRSKALLVASPANPTGTMISPNAMSALADGVAGRGGALLVDEIYHGLTYGCDAATALSLSDEIFVINSFSKYFGMTGWRLGWMVAPQDYMADIEKLAQNLFISASDIAQQAAIAAFSPEAVRIHEERHEAFRAQRDFLLPRLRDLGFDIPVEPTGAFYIYANCERHTADSYAFCIDVLEKAGVAIAPGIDFGHHRAAQHVRFSYPKPLPVLAEGVARLENYLRKR